MSPLPYAPPSEITSEKTPEVDDTKQATPRFISMVYRILSVISLLSAGLFVGWMITFGSGVSAFAVGIAVLISAPYLLLWFACRSLTSYSGAVLIALSLGGIVWVGVDAFRAVDNDAQGGLNLIFAPLFQLAAWFAMMLLAVTADWAERQFDAIVRARTQSGTRQED